MSMIVLAWYRNSLEMKRSYWILIFSLVSDDGVDDDDEKVDGVDGDVDVWGLILQRIGARYGWIIN